MEQAKTVLGMGFLPTLIIRLSWTPIIILNIGGRENNVRDSNDKCSGNVCSALLEPNTYSKISALEKIVKKINDKTRDISLDSLIKKRLVIESIFRKSLLEFMINGHIYQR